MKGLPKSTEMKKQIPKSAIFKKYRMDSKGRERFDEDISRIFIMNEVSPHTIAIAKGQKIESFFIVCILLKHKKYDDSNIVKICKLINQNMIFLLEHEQKVSIAVYRNKLHCTEWSDLESISLRIQGLNLDEVWKNLILQIGGILIENNNSLDDQIVLDMKKERVQKKIDSLEVKARSERQPKKKYKLINKIKKMKLELGDV